LSVIGLSSIGLSSAGLRGKERRQYAGKKPDQNEKSQLFHAARSPGPDYFRNFDGEAEKKQDICVVWQGGLATLLVSFLASLLWIGCSGARIG
jgi:hypothetical protein